MSSSTAGAESTVRAARIPRGAKRRVEIAAVAERIFFKHGFADSTMQTIAAEAGASKETLYRHFGSKEGLFAEIVENRANHFLERLDESLQRRGAIGEVLHDLGRRMLEVMMASDGVCLARLVVAETSRNPQLGLIFFEQGPERVRKRLTQFLAAAQERGELRCPDPGLAARVFLGGIVSHYFLMALVLSERPVIGVVQIEAHMTEVVAMFLAYYAVR